MSATLRPSFLIGFFTFAQKVYSRLKLQTCLRRLTSSCIQERTCALGVVTNAPTLRNSSVNTKRKPVNATNAFDQRLQHVPASWRDALVEVIDTAESVVLGLRQDSFGVQQPATECPQLVADLTRLVCERRDTSRRALELKAMEARQEASPYVVLTPSETP